jgi:hypothetical protein
MLSKILNYCKPMNQIVVNAKVFLPDFKRFSTITKPSIMPMIIPTLKPLTYKINQFGEHTIMYSKTKKIIKDRCKVIDNKRSNILYTEFTDLTRHYINDTYINLTPLMNKYKISGAMLFLYMNNEAYFAKYKTPNAYKECCRVNGLLASNSVIEKNNVIDKYNDIVIKNTFRKTLDEEQIINMLHYDNAGTEGLFYTSVLSLLNGHIKYEHSHSIRNEETEELIKKICFAIYPINPRKLLNEFINNTSHSLNDTQVDVTELMDKYDIKGYELFYSMYHQSRPFSAGVFAYNKEFDNSFKLEDAKIYLEKHQYGADYVNGKPIKNWFRQNNNKGDLQTINVRKFDDRTYLGCFYRCILEIVKTKFLN